MKTLIGIVTFGNLVSWVNGINEIIRTTESPVDCEFEPREVAS